MTIQIGSSWLKTQKDRESARGQVKEDFWEWTDREPVFRIRGDKYDPTKCNIVAVKTFPETTPSGQLELISEWSYGRNIVTNAGEAAYAIEAVSGTLTTTGCCANDFQSADGRHQMRTMADTPAATDNRSNVLGLDACTRSAIDACYPKNNDCDACNPGCTSTAVDTWRISYGACCGNACAIQGGIICAGGMCPGANQALLTHYSITSFNKTMCDTLKVYINHTFNGV